MKAVVQRVGRASVRVEGQWGARHQDLCDMNIKT